jgi:hypothetical protein
MLGIALDHAAEHQAGRRDGGVERIADQVVEVIVFSRSTPATLFGCTMQNA